MRWNNNNNNNNNNEDNKMMTIVMIATQYWWWWQRCGGSGQGINLKLFTGSLNESSEWFAYKLHDKKS